MSVQKNAWNFCRDIKIWFLLMESKIRGPMLLTFSEFSRSSNVFPFCYFLVCFWLFRRANEAETWRISGGNEIKHWTPGFCLCLSAFCVWFTLCSDVSDSSTASTSAFTGISSQENTFEKKQKISHFRNFDNQFSHFPHFFMNLGFWPFSEMFAFWCNSFALGIR